MNIDLSALPHDLLSPIKQQKVYLQIVNQFVDLIEQGEFKSGMQLPPERQLARYLGVSRSSLREALTVLQMLGLVETVSGEGTFITGKPGEAIKNYLNNVNVGESPFVIIQARKAIEPSIASLAATQRSESDLKRIADVLAWIESDHSEEHVLGDIFSEGDREFHLEIAKATANPIVISIQEMFHSLMGQELWLTLMRHTSFSTPGRWEEAFQEHRGIFDAIKQGDARAASHLMKNHLQRVEKIMIEADLISTASLENRISKDKSK
ncbi:MAG: FadR/GntR family transcriptional regulator [Anaerolineales bacterium]